MSKDPRIDAYIAEAAPFARPILHHLRQLVHRGNPALEETIKWSMPFFTYRGKLFAHLAAFKAHAAFDLHPREMAHLLGPVPGKAGEAMGLLGRITSLADLPGDKALLAGIRAATKLHDAGGSTRAKPKPKPALPVPADLAAGLKRSKTAAATWEKFSPSCRREYIDWLTEAKRDETRELRLATTLEWLAEGKSRNWKYQNC
jgi:uncharacterized protein YdeI (YjbR/CyaY-like superfamily)